MSLFFDALIFGFLAADLALLILLLSRKNAKTKKSTIPLCGIVLLAWLVVFYGSFIEPNIIVVNQLDINLTENPKDPIRTAFVSDIHVGPYKQKDFVEKMVKKINSLNPDLILLGGDFLAGEDIHTEYLLPLADLHAKYGKYAILGNHDYEEDFDLLEGPNFDYTGNKRVEALVKTLKNADVTLLINSSVEIEGTTKNKFLLGGVDEYWTRRASVSKTFAGKDVSLPKVLLAHNPDVVHDAVINNVNLVLSGHTHGGQIRLPFIGSVPPIPDKLGRKYDMGLFRFEDTQLFITSGIGETGPRARLFDPPEIVMMNLKF